MEANTLKDTPGVDSKNAPDIPKSPTLDELWVIVEPTLNEFMDAGPDVTKLPPEKYSVIYTLVYNYVWSTRTGGNFYELSEKLDNYFATIARRLHRDSPKSAADDQTLIRSTLDTFDQFKLKARYIGDRLFNAYNRHHVRRAKDKGEGWVSHDREEGELSKWGCDQGGSEELLAQTVASAEAGSDLDRIIPVGSVALRRFRLDFVQPLLDDPKGFSGNESRDDASNACLAKAIEHLLDSKDVEESDKRAIAQGLADMFRDIGVHYKHPLRKKLDGFVNHANA